MWFGLFKHFTPYSFMTTELEVLGLGNIFALPAILSTVIVLRMSISLQRNYILKHIGMTVN